MARRLAPLDPEMSVTRDGTSPLRERLSSALLVAAVPVVVFAFHWRAARPGWAFAGSDLVEFFVPQREWVLASLRAGRFPLWQRGAFLGYPIVADPQAALFDLVTWLTVPWDAARGLTLATLLHLVVMGWGMVFWMRARGLGRLESFLAAVLFALGAKQTVHLQHWNFAATIAWWPWMLGAVDAFVADGRRRWLWLLAGSVGATWLGGSPPMAYLGTMLLGAWALVATRALWPDRRRDALLAWVAIGCGLLLAMPLVLPAAELAGLGSRAGKQLGYGFAAEFGWRTAYDLLLLVVPGAFGSEPWARGTNLWEATGYLAILPVGLAAAAPWRRRGNALLAVVAVLGIWLAFGDRSWLGLHEAAWRFLPGFGLFRVPTRGLMVTAFCVAALAAEGLARLRRDPAPVGRRAATATLATLAVLALAVPRLPSFPLDRDGAILGGGVAALLAALGIGWIWAGAAARRHRAWALAAVVLCLADLHLAFGAMNPVAPAEAFVPTLAPLSPLVPPAPAPRRVGFVGPAFANQTLWLGWEGVTGYGPSIIERVRETIESTRLRPGAAARSDLLRPTGNPTSPLWPLLAAPLVVTSGRPLPLPTVASIPLPRGGQALLQAAPALPRVFWTGAFVRVVDGEAWGWMPAAASGDRAIVSEDLPFPSGPPGPPVAADAIRVSDRELEAQVVAPAAGLVVVLDPWFPGWEATVDGVPTPIVRADHAFQGIPVTAGPHRIVLTYRSAPLRLGLALAAAGVAVLCVTTWATRRRGGAVESTRAV